MQVVFGKPADADQRQVEQKAADQQAMVRVNPAQQLLVINKGQHAKGKVGNVAHKGCYIQRQYCVRVTAAKVIAGLPDELQQDYLDEEAVQLVLQAAVGKITQKQRIDGIKAKERTEKGHVHGAAAADDEIGCVAQAVAGIAKKAGTCKVKQ